MQERDGSLSPIRNTEFAIDRRQMELHGMYGHVEVAGDLSIRESLGSHLEYLDLARREPVNRTLRVGKHTLMLRTSAFIAYAT